MLKKRILGLLSVVFFIVVVNVNNIDANDTLGFTSKTFTIEESDTLYLGGNYSNDLFNYTIVNTSSNGQYDGNRINYYDFKNTLTMKDSTTRKLVDFVLSYDYFYYSVNYWGANANGIAMLYDNTTHRFKLPDPWVIDATNSLDTSHSLNSTNNDQGVNVFVTDQNPGAANVEDLSYMKKSNITSIISQTMDDVNELNAATGYNVKEPSIIGLDAELPTIQFNIQANLINTPITKNIRVHQEKIGVYGVDGGRWYSISFTPTAKYTYQFERELQVTNPIDLVGIDGGELATFTSNVTVINNESVDFTKQWQVSKDGGNTFEDIPNANDETYSFTTSDEDDGNLYRLKVTPTNAVGSDTVMYSEPASLQVNKKVQTIGEIIIEYVDQEGNAILPSERLEAAIGSTHSIDSKVIANYTLVNDTRFDVVITQTPQTIQFIYKLNKGMVISSKITVKYVDLQGNELLHSEIVEGTTGTNYKVVAKQINDYKLVSKQVLEGVYGGNDQTLIFQYEKIVDQNKQQSSTAVTTKASVATADHTNNMILWLMVLTSLSIIGWNMHRRRSR